jgi:hypothetical protein
MLPDVLIPVLDLNGTADPAGDCLAALRLLEGAAGDAGVLVPGHGSAGGADQVRARIDQDRAYVQAVRDAHVPDDPRIGPSAKDGWDWVAGVHARQLQRLTRRSERDGTPGQRPRHQLANWRRSSAYSSRVRPRYPARSPARHGATWL